MTAATNTKSAETAVRTYLLYLEDPGKLRDESEIQKKTAAVLDANDPIEKLKALADLERVANIDEVPLREGFVQHAKRWATEQSIPLSAFRELKVPDDLLREAGFDLPASRRRGRGAGAGDGRQRAKAVPVDEIKAFVLGQKGTFILNDVMGGVGGSPATVRKAVDELIDARQVDKLGPVPDYHGRGRAPIQYKTR
ncbi:MAG: hypothetical protein ACRD2C_12190 [Acidimicrobiales bacterium]